MVETLITSIAGRMLVVSIFLTLILSVVSVKYRISMTAGNCTLGTLD